MNENSWEITLKEGLYANKNIDNVPIGSWNLRWNQAIQQLTLLLTNANFETINIY